MDTNHEQRDARLPYLPGLDGLRACAVIAVVLYHAGLPVWGGFLGVESFFAISGFLITALLVAEWHAYGRVNLKVFWLRRARRLLPALFLMIAGTLTYASIWLPDETAGLRADAFAALGYVMNWHLVLSQQSYFDPMLRPSLLQHLWSLAVEEQFYLVWPLLFVVGTRFLRPRVLLLVTLAATATSIALMARLYEPGTDPSRVYYGTDTRAAGLLLGVAFGLVWMPWRNLATARRRTGRLLDLVGLVALGGLLTTYSLISEQDPSLYRGGFICVTIATLAVVAAVTHPQTRLMPAILGCKLLRWVGTRSYSIYLWHWPVFQVTRPYQDLAFDGWQLLALRLAVTVSLAEASYRWVERPARQGALGVYARKLWEAITVPRMAGQLGLVDGPVVLSTRASMPPSSAQRSDTIQSKSMSRSLIQRTVCMHNVRISGSSLLLSVCAFVLSSSACTFEAPASVPTAAIAVATSASSATAGQPTTAPPVASPSPAAAAGVTPLVDATQQITPSAVATAEPAPSATTAVEATNTAEPAPTEVALASFDPALAAKLQTILDQTVANGTIPGALVSVNIPGYETWYGASGVTARKGGEPMNPETRYRIASISKVFTAVVVLQLIEEGKIALDAPIDTYLPDLLRNGDAITVHNLLNHTSGLYDYLEDRNFVNRAYREPNRLWQPQELVAYATRFPPSFQPGAKNSWDYSSTNYVILGMLVEQVTGNTMAQEVRQRVFEPLELNSSYFVPYEEVQGTLAHGYSNAIDQTNVSLSFAFSTANIVSTVEDVNRFGQALFGGKLLKPETLNLMYSFVNGKGQYNMPALEYGLGVMRNRLPVGPAPDGQKRSAETTTVLGHIGGFGGFRSALWHAPEGNVTIALGVNQAATDPNILATKVFDAVLTHQGR